MPRRLPPRAERLAAPDPRDGPPLSEAELERRLREGAALFDAGAFFDSHEAWEAAWHRAPPGERDFFRGLIHAAAACLHHARGNRHGHARQAARMAARLAGYRPAHRGVAVAALLDAIEALPPPGTATRYPRLGLAARKEHPEEEGEGEGEEPTDGAPTGGPARRRPR